MEDRGGSDAPAGTNERASPLGCRPLAPDERAMVTLAEIIGAASAALVTDDESKATAPPHERNGRLTLLSVASRPCWSEGRLTMRR